MNDGRSRRYQAYLLRLWRADDFTPWRATLVDPHSGDLLHFASLERLSRFLAEWAVPHRPDEGSGPRK